MPRKTSARGAQGGGTIRQRPNGKWEARITIGRDPGTGKQKQRSFYGNTQKEVLQKMKEIESQIMKGTYQEPSRMTVGEWLDIWLKEYCTGLKQRTIETYESNVRQYLKPAFGNIKLQKLTKIQVQATINHWEREGNSKGKAMQPKFIKNLHGALQAALNQALDAELIARNPAERVKLPRIEKKAVKTLEEAEVPMFLEAASGDPFERMYWLALFTGLRQAELIGLTWDCVDFNNGTLRVYRQLQKLNKGYAFGIRYNKLRKLKMRKK